MRYRIHQRPVPGIRREADLVFPSRRIAVFVDGCWWHGCPEHRVRPTANAAWWEAKFVTTRERDADTDARLRETGWTVVRVWEHESADRAADVIEEMVRAH